MQVEASQVLFRRVLDHVKYEGQRTRKKTYKRQLQHLKMVNAALRQTLAKQAEANATLQQTVEKQTQLLEQSGISPRKIADGYVTSRLRTPSKRKCNVKSPSLSTPLAGVLESPQTQLSRSLSQLGVNSNNNNSSNNNVFMSPMSSTSPSRIPLPPSLRARGVVCVHGRSFASCVLCLGSPLSVPKPASQKRTPPLVTGENMKLVGTQDTITTTSRPTKTATPPKLRSSSSRVPTAISEMKTKSPKPSESKSSGSSRSNIVSIHFEDVQEKRPPPPPPPLSHFVGRPTQKRSSLSPSTTATALIKDKENKTVELESSGGSSYSQRTANILRAVSTAVRDRRISR